MVIYACFDPRWRSEIARCIKSCGIAWTIETLIEIGHDPVFARAICRNIMRREGW